jgi:hypothetical protein
MIEAIEPEAELFALAEQVDLAEKAFHDALAQQIKRLAEGGDHFAILPGGSIWKHLHSGNQSEVVL